MNRMTCRFWLYILMVVTLFHAQAKPIPEAVAKKIADAMPKQAPAKPSKMQKLLVYSDCGGFVHGSIPVGNLAFQIMGRETGTFETVVTNDLDYFTAEKLAEFDGVLFNNNTGELFKPRKPRKPQPPNRKKIKSDEAFKKAEEKWQVALDKWEKDMVEASKIPDRSEELRASLMAWVKNGGAVIGIHAATDCSYQWKEYGQMMGGYFAGHPWGAGDTVTIKNGDPDNPINAAFQGQGITLKEEIYQFNRGIYSREKQRVLLSLDMTQTPEKSGNRADKDYAISWIKTHGKGRVFYCSLGHNNEIFSNPKVLQHYLAGIQWALGDLKNVEIAPNPLP